jgi:hypothetical protein
VFDYPTPYFNYNGELNHVHLIWMWKISAPTISVLILYQALFFCLRKNSNYVVVVVWMILCFFFFYKKWNKAHHLKKEADFLYYYPLFPHFEWRNIIAFVFYGKRCHYTLPLYMTRNYKNNATDTASLDISRSQVGSDKISNGWEADPHCTWIFKFQTWNSLCSLE